MLTCVTHQTEGRGLLNNSHDLRVQRASFNDIDYHLQVCLHMQ